MCVCVHVRITRELSVPLMRFQTQTRNLDNPPTYLPILHTQPSIPLPPCPPPPIPNPPTRTHLRLPPSLPFMSPAPEPTSLSLLSSDPLPLPLILRSFSKNQEGVKKIPIAREDMVFRDQKPLELKTMVAWNPGGGPLGR